MLFRSPREYDGFLARESYWSGGNRRGVALRDGINIYGMFVDTGALQDFLVALSLNLGGREIGKRRVGKECRSRWSPYH